ncbi:hypothetical protein HDU76_009598, partial [Blyttiomyces sp. JEL0837]
VGDPVIVKCKFDDGWGYGFNMTTKMEGSFPLACVSPYLNNNDNGQAPQRGDEWQDGSGSNVNRASFSIRQRQSSMYGPPAGFRESQFTVAAPTEFSGEDGEMGMSWGQQGQQGGQQQYGGYRG